MESQQQSQEANQQEQGKCNAANVLTIKCKNLEIIHEIFLQGL